MKVVSSVSKIWYGSVRINLKSRAILEMINKFISLMYVDSFLKIGKIWKDLETIGTAGF